jgi:hypothetical protein
VQDRPPQQARDLDDAPIAQELGEVAAQRTTAVVAALPCAWAGSD